MHVRIRNTIQSSLLGGLFPLIDGMTRLDGGKWVGIKYLQVASQWNFITPHDDYDDDCV